MLKGIDVSEHNGRIDWDIVKKSGIVDYVMIRAGYGRGNVDKQFSQNIQECQRVGLPCGIYWFSYGYTVEMARQEARYCLDLIKGCNIHYPISFDLEYDTITYAKKNGVTIGKSLATAMANAFCAEIQRAGYKPMNYTNLDYYKNMFGQVPYDMWYAQYANTRSITGMTMWQYTSSGSVPGISGKVDLNYCYKDYMGGKTPAEDKQEEPTGNPIIRAGQEHCNNFTGAAISCDGIWGPETQRAAVMALQTALNMDYRSELTVDGIWGSASDRALGSHYVCRNECQYMVTALEILLMLKGYNPNGVECPGSFGSGLESAVRQYQKDHGLTVDGIAGRNTFMSLVAW
ncbi:MAG: GH25 family lysozyme [Blautia sp.]|uniref:GH25 family lysozyme n=1 Tax=Blautia sp. TaxID=1955243 RepID=UPI00204D3ACD|nr:MAG TPA: hypothetical protein [Caudoviricetes sp.]